MSNLQEDLRFVDEIAEKLAICPQKKKIKRTRILKKDIFEIIKETKERKRKYHTHPDYFNEINNECKAYFLGLLLTDGCNTNGGIQISLQDGDQHILEQISKTIFVELRPLSLVNLENQRKQGKNVKNQWRLSIHNKKIAKHMESFGLIPRKSLILQYPPENVVSKELFPHFLRGLFDGDGCISGRFYKNPQKKEISFSIVSASQNFLISLQQKIKEYLNLPSTVNLHHKPDLSKNHHEVYILTILNGQQPRGRNMEDLYLSLYKNATYYLERKRKRFDQYMMAKHYYKLPKSNCSKNSSRTGLFSDH